MLQNGNGQVLSINKNYMSLNVFKKQKVSKLVSKFNIRVQTVPDLYKHKNKLNEFAANNNSRLSKRKAMKRASLDDLDKALFLWFNQK